VVAVVATDGSVSKTANVSLFLNAPYEKENDGFASPYDLLLATADTAKTAFVIFDFNNKSCVITCLLSR